MEVIYVNETICSIVIIWLLLIINLGVGFFFDWMVEGEGCVHTCWEHTHLVIVLIDVFVQFMQSHQGIEVT